MRYIIRRLLQTLVVVFGVSIVAFGMLFLTGDPTEVILGDAADRMTVAQIQEFRIQRGFDRPWYVQYFSFVGNALQGDFGYSFIRHKPAYEVIAERLPATIQLASFAFVLSLIVSIPLGVLAATRAHKPADYIVSVLALVGQSDSELLAWHPAHPSLRRLSPLAADLGKRYLAAPHPAGHHAGGISDRPQYASHSIINARFHAAGFRPHCSGKGHYRAEGDL
jgi:hypothetical protein